MSERVKKCRSLLELSQIQTGRKSPTLSWLVRSAEAVDALMMNTGSSVELPTINVGPAGDEPECAFCAKHCDHGETQEHEPDCTWAALEKIWSETEPDTILHNTERTS